MTWSRRSCSLKGDKLSSSWSTMTAVPWALWASPQKPSAIAAISAKKEGCASVTRCSTRYGHTLSKSLEQFYPFLRWSACPIFPSSSSNKFLITWSWYSTSPSQCLWRPRKRRSSSFSGKALSRSNWKGKRNCHNRKFCRETTLWSKLEKRKEPKRSMHRYSSNFCIARITTYTLRTFRNTLKTYNCWLIIGSRRTYSW